MERTEVKSVMDFVQQDFMSEPEFVSKLAMDRLTYVEQLPKSSVVVFINTKSGGQLGTSLLKTFTQLLGSRQVFDLKEVDPHVALANLLSNIQELEAGDGELALAARQLRKTLKVVVAGGDGTAGWLLGAATDLSLDNPIPVATLPLGTGNNLPFTFGWGKRNPGTDAQSTKRFLRQVGAAQTLKVDRWRLTVTMEEKAKHLPPSLRSLSQSRDKHDNSWKCCGSFWNYFSLGMDAEVSYQFHKERREHPEKFSNQLWNQSTYARIGCSQGWFCAPCLRPSSMSINEIATVYIADRDGPWKELQISSSIRSLVLLNLPSFSGGLDPWGNPNDKKFTKRGLTSPSVDDGKLEVVGFRDGWHGLFLLFPKGHGARLAQAHRVKLEFKSSRAGYTYMRMDGEPWRQPLPRTENTTSIEISHHGQGVMLARKGCIAERKDAYEHKLLLTKHGLEHGLRLKTQNERFEGNDDSCSQN